MESPPRVLIADDQPDILKALRLLLKGEGFAIKCTGSPREALEALRTEEFDVACLDLNYARDTTSGQEGLDLLKTIRRLDANLPVVVMTAWATVEVAVECMRQGAADFIQKPWDNARVVTILKNQTELYRTRSRRDLLEDENRLLRADGPVDFLARSAAMRPIVEVVERVAPSDAHVLITGENGTGKGVVARVLHQKSHRAREPFVAVNMGGLASGLADSELFGHVKGAFTDARQDRAGRFEMADGGTLFLDEIANLPMEQQNKILRVLETGEFERVGSSRTRRVKVRFISATNADLDKQVAEGKFRQDLLFRLNTIAIHLPPLRERFEDIPWLADYFLKRHLAKYRKPPATFSPAALTALQSYPWPGNVRELDHCLERAVLLWQGEQIQPQDLGLKGLSPGVGPAPSLDEMSLEEVEKHLIQRTLLRHGGNAVKAAGDLGLSRSAFYRRLQRFGL